MNADALRKFAREHAVSNLGTLVMACRQRFLAAAALMEWQTPIVAGVAGLGIRTPPELWLLFSSHALLCQRYIDLFYTPQRSLLPHTGAEPDEKWSNYFHHQLNPSLVSNDDVVRNVLRVAGGLPCRDPQAAAAALCQHVEEMTLPDCLPAWIPA